MKDQEIIHFLKNTKIFTGLNEDQCKEVSKLFKAKTYKSEEHVISIGEPSDAVHLILKGTCRVSVPFDFGMGENILTYMKSGELIGEMGVITGNERSANVLTCIDCEILSMSYNDFWDIARKYDVILTNIIRILSDRIIFLNEGKKSRTRASLNLDTAQKNILKDFHDYIEGCNQALIALNTKNRVRARNYSKPMISGFKLFIYKLFLSIINFFTSPYISSIEGIDNIPKDKPVIFILNLRAYFDILFFYSIYKRLNKERVVSFAVNINIIPRLLFHLIKWFYSCMFVTYLRKNFKDPFTGAEDTINFINSANHSDLMVDIALHPFLKRSMRYDVHMEYDHLNILRNLKKGMEVIPVTLSGTDKFWPFEPWNRRFFDVLAFFSFNSVQIKIGKPISLEDIGFTNEIDKIQNNEDLINIYEKANMIIGETLAGLEGFNYKPVHRAGSALIKRYNDLWVNRLSLMLPAGLALRRKYQKPSFKVRHFIWHAEMLNVLLTHLEGEDYHLPIWAKGMLIHGASHADMYWPFFSMDHSYSPYTKKGMKLIVRFPSLMRLIKKEIYKLLNHHRRSTDIERVLIKLGLIFHLMSDLSIPAHVHNIPHMFIDFPRIGKCDFEEYLGLDPQLMTLSDLDIGDISTNEITNWQQFYDGLDQMARYTFLNSSFNLEQLKEFAKERMIVDTETKKDLPKNLPKNLIKRLNKMGVTIYPALGYESEERFYARNLTTAQCARISQKTTYYSLKMISACYIFLLGQVYEKLWDN
jgi:CRP-like cAMP-binding protein